MRTRIYLPVLREVARMKWSLAVLRRERDLPAIAAKLRWIYWRHVRRYDYEVCHECGRPVGRELRTWWHAPDQLWLEVIGEEQGILCPGCFVERASALGVLVYFEAALYDRRVPA